MRKIERLKREARNAANWREHDMSNFITLSDKSAVATCNKCDMEVYVDAKPAPNGIDISGEAVALNCTK